MPKTAGKYNTKGRVPIKERWNDPDSLEFGIKSSAEAAKRARAAGGLYGSVYGKSHEIDAKRKAARHNELTNPQRRNNDVKDGSGKTVRKGK